MPVYHFDAYRLSGPREFLELGADEYLAGDGVCLIEWADRVADALPADYLRLDIEPVGDTGRRFTLTATGERHTAAVEIIAPRSEAPEGRQKLSLIPGVRTPG